MLHEPALRLKRTEPHFLNRELSLLAFNRRVLAQAEDRRMPMIERLRFLCIVSSNMDEFFEIRVAELKERIKLGGDVDQRGEGAATDMFRIVSERAHTMVAEQYRLLNEEILPGMAEEGVRFLHEPNWTREQRRWLHDYFVR